MKWCTGTGTQLNIHMTMLTGLQGYVITIAAPRYSRTHTMPMGIYRLIRIRSMAKVICICTTTVAGWCKRQIKTCQPTRFLVSSSIPMMIRAGSPMCTIITWTGIHRRFPIVNTPMIRPEILLRSAMAEHREIRTTHSMTSDVWKKKS